MAMDLRWYRVMALCKLAQRIRDHETRSALLSDLVDAINKVDQDKMGALESAFQDDNVVGDQGA